MIHYHNVEGGMPNREKAVFLTGRHGIVSFAYQNNADLAFSCCQSVILDNGAYTIWSKSKKSGEETEIDYDAYVEWVRFWRRHPAFDWALIPDCIGGDEADNDEWVQRWPEEMRMDGVPVWHPDESIGRLMRLSNDWRTVAIGGSPIYPKTGSRIWWERMKEVMDAITDEEGRPPCKLHGLKILDPEVFRHLPLSSGDSGSALQRANEIEKFGRYPPPDKASRAGVIADRIEQHASAAVWRKTGQKRIGFEVGEHGDGAA
jgi:hypothetical protein